MLAPRGTLVCAVTTRIVPGSVLRREEAYPDDLAQAAAAAACGCSPSTPRHWRREAGTLRAVNVALLGAASTALPFSRSRGGGVWRRPCRRRSWKSTSGRSRWGASPSREEDVQ